MKQNIFILLFGLSISISSFAQFSAGLETGLPINNTLNIGDFGLGGSIKYEASIKNKFSWTSTIGYLSFSEKSQYDQRSRTKTIPMLGGIKYYFSDPSRGFYAAADLGLNFIIVTTYDLPPFPVELHKIYIRSGFCPSIGYRTNRWDFTGKYNVFGWSDDGRYDSKINLNYVSLRAAYIFGSK